MTCWIFAWWEWFWFEPFASPNTGRALMITVLVLLISTTALIIIALRLAFLALLVRLGLRLLAASRIK
jgi:hypothetical protein